jgi:hypothetical protein
MTRKGQSLGSEPSAEDQYTHKHNFAVPSTAKSLAILILNSNAMMNLDITFIQFTQI